MWYTLSAKTTLTHRDKERTQQAYYWARPTGQRIIGLSLQNHNIVFGLLPTGSPFRRVFVMHCLRLAAACRWPTGVRTSAKFLGAGILESASGAAQPWNTCGHITSKWNNLHTSPISKGTDVVKYYITVLCLRRKESWKRRWLSPKSIILNAIMSNVLLYKPFFK